MKPISQKELAHLLAPTNPYYFSPNTRRAFGLVWYGGYIVHRTNEEYAIFFLELEKKAPIPRLCVRSYECGQKVVRTEAVFTLEQAEDARVYIRQLANRYKEAIS